VASDLCDLERKATSVQVAEDQVEMKSKSKTKLVTLELRFKSEKDRDEWFGRYLDGGGEQHIECYVEDWARDKSWMTIRVEEI